MKAFVRKSPHLIRILVSETDEWLRDIIADLVHQMSKVGVCLAVITPPTIWERDLLEIAAKQPFDAAVLLVNNISYAPYNPSTRVERLDSDALAFVTKMIRLFHKPVIALYGWPARDTMRHSCWEPVRLWPSAFLVRLKISSRRSSAVYASGDLIPEAQRAGNTSAST